MIRMLCRKPWILLLLFPLLCLLICAVSLIPVPPTPPTEPQLILPVTIGHPAWNHGANAIAVYGAIEGEVTLWRLEDEPVSISQSFPGDIMALGWSPDDTRLAVVLTNLTLYVWHVDADSVDLLATPDQFPIHYGQIPWRPDGRQIATIGGERNIVWDAETGEEVAAFSDVGIGWSADGRRILLHSWYDASIVADADTFEPIFEETHLMDASLSPDGTHLAEFPVSRVWDVDTGQIAVQLEPVSIPGYTDSFMLWRTTWSPDGNFIAGGGGYQRSTADDWFRNDGYCPADSDNVIRIWDASTGKLVHLLEGHRCPINALYWHPERDLLLSYSQQDSTVRVWNTLTGQPEQIIHLPVGVYGVISPDGNRVAGIDEARGLLIWDVE